MQRGVGAAEVVPPYTALPYCWDKPDRAHYLTVGFEPPSKQCAEGVVSDFRQAWCLDKIKTYPEVAATVEESDERGKLQRKEVLIAAEIVAEGPVRRLIVYDSHRHMVVQSARALAPNLFRTTDVSFSLLVELAGLGVSLVNENPQEICYLAAENFYFKVAQLTKMPRDELELRLENLQIDNQLFDAHFPVVLQHRVMARDVRPLLQLSIVRNTEYQAMQFFEYFSFQLLEVDLNLDEVFICKLTEFFEVTEETLVEDAASLNHYNNPTDQSHAAVKEKKGGSGKKEKGPASGGGSGGGSSGGGGKEKEEKEIDAEVLGGQDDGAQLIRDLSQYSELQTASEDSQAMYFEIFQIHPIKITVSFAPVISSGGGFDSPVRNMMLTLGINLPTIEGAPLQLNTIWLTHAFTSQDELVESLYSHYSRQMVREGYKIVGSLHFLGNPVSLAQNLGTGFKDFFYEPYQGLVKSPEEFVEGVEKGAKSLVKNSVFGVSSSASSVAESFGTGIARVALSNEYVTMRERRGRERPKDMSEGVALGARDLTMGFVDGVTGVVRDPVSGASEGGRGFFKGIGRGIIGAAVKPTVGALDTFSRTAQGVKAAATDSAQGRGRMRLPRYISESKTLEPYSEEKAHGQDLLYRVQEGRYMGEFFVEMEPVGHDRVFLISNHSALMLRPEANQCIWRVAIRRIRALEEGSAPNKLVLKFNRRRLGYVAGIGLSDDTLAVQKEIELTSPPRRDYLLHLLRLIHKVEMDTGKNNVVEVFEQFTFQ